MDLDRVFAQTGAKKVFVITDYFRAAKSNADVEFKQGRDAIDTAKAAGVDHLIFMSVADAEFFDEHTKHLKAKVALKKVAAALSKASGVPVKARLAMPIFLRRLFLKDLHHMFLYYKVHKGPRGTPEAFRKGVPDALTAEDWFRFHGRYTNGELIAPRTTSG